MLVIVMALQFAVQDAPPARKSKSPARMAPPVIVQVQPASTVTVRPAPEEELNDTNICGALTQFVKNRAGEMPVAIDAATRLDGFDLSCPGKRLSNRVTMLVRLDQMRPGWQARKEADWSKHICSNPHYLTIYKLGWRFSQNMTFKGGEIVTLDAKCEV